MRSRLASGTVKLAVKLTPKILIRGVANIVLKGIAHFSRISFDLNSRTAFVTVTLHGEQEPIEISVDGFEIRGDEQKYQFILHNAKSNKPWMTNIFARLTGKAWDIPDVPKFGDELKLAANLLEAKTRRTGRR